MKRLFAVAWQVIPEGNSSRDLGAREGVMLPQAALFLSKVCASLVHTIPPITLVRLHHLTARGCTGVEAGTFLHPRRSLPSFHDMVRHQLGRQVQVIAARYLARVSLQRHHVRSRMRPDFGGMAGMIHTHQELMICRHVYTKLLTGAGRGSRWLMTGIREVLLRDLRHLPISPRAWMASGRRTPSLVGPAGNAKTTAYLFHGGFRHAEFFSSPVQWQVEQCCDAFARELEGSVLPRAFRHSFSLAARKQGDCGHASLMAGTRRETVPLV